MSRDGEAPLQYFGAPTKRGSHYPAWPSRRKAGVDYYYHYYYYYYYYSIITGLLEIDIGSLERQKRKSKILFYPAYMFTVLYHLKSKIQYQQ